MTGTHDRPPPEREALIREMYALYQTGADLQQVGAKYGFSSERVRQLFQRLDLPRRKGEDRLKAKSCLIARQPYGSMDPDRKHAERPDNQGVVKCGELRVHAASCGATRCSSS